MPNDRDKAALGKRLNGEHDPKDPDGLITLDDLAGPDGGAGIGEEPPIAHEEASDEYPHVPGRHKATRHDYNNDEINPDGDDPHRG